MKHLNKRSIIWIVVVLSIAFLLPVGQKPYIQHLLTLTLIYSIFALSYDLILGYSGHFSFGHQAFFGLGGYTAALLSAKLGLPVWATLPASLGVSAVAGYLIGWVSLRMRGVYLGFVTLGFAMLLWLVMVNERAFTGGVSGVKGIMPLELSVPGLLNLKLDSAFEFYYFALALLLFTIYLISRLLRSRFGKALVALKENEEAAIAIGINPFQYYLRAFTIGATLAGLAGFAFCYYLRFISPLVFGINYLWYSVIMVVIGGSGTLLGPVIGAFIFAFVPEAFRIVEALRMVFFGVALTTVIIFLPQGIYPSLVSLWKRFALHAHKNNNTLKKMV